MYHRPMTRRLANAAALVAVSSFTLALALPVGCSDAQPETTAGREKPSEGAGAVVDSAPITPTGRHTEAGAGVHGFSTSACSLTATQSPFWAGEQKRNATAGAANDRFGRAIAVSGDGATMVTGAPNATGSITNSGAAYVYTKNLPGVWTYQATLWAFDAGRDDDFGISVAISGDGNVAVVGANASDDRGSATGSIYVFRRTGTTWAHEQKILPTAALGGDRVGWSVAISDDGTRIATGAFAHDGAALDAGAVFTFTFGGVNSWHTDATLVAPDAEADDDFGWSVALSADGHRLIVGARGEDAGGSGAGAAYIFSNDGTSWSVGDKVVSPDAAAGDSFGRDVSIADNGDRVLVGSHGDDQLGSGAGAAYVFDHGAGWTVTQTLLPSAPLLSTYFGYAVSLAGDGQSAAVSAYRDEVNGDNSGSVDFFALDGGAFCNLQKIVASDGAAGHEFGHAVSLSADGLDAAVGARFATGVGTNTGAAYVYTLPKNECVSGENDCSVNAMCTDTADGFSCACNLGYTGDGNNCEDIDECATGNGGCDAIATCTNAAAPADAPTCDCPAGYETSDAGATCSDIDECVVVNGGCDVVAACQNGASPGDAPVCTCPAGYGTSDGGATCLDVDECLTNNGGCDLNATCSNAPGTSSCECDPGYEGDGSTCAVADECLVNNGGCDALATCAYTAGGPSLCTCPFGYSTADGGQTCNDIDECATGGDNCDVNATCTNTPGAFSCTCGVGFFGDGTLCVTIDECLASDEGCAANPTVAGSSHASGRGLASSLGLGAAGAPGEALNCESCHTPSAFGLTTDLRLEDEAGDDVNHIRLGETIDVSLAYYFANFEARFGFQVAALVGPQELGRWSDVGSSSQISSAANPLGRQYWEHDVAIGGGGLHGTRWTPHSAGEATFYFGGVSHDPAGDAVAMDTRSLSVCGEGSVFDGTSCILIGECLNDSGNCDANAACTNTGASSICECNTGYAGAGQTCGLQSIFGRSTHSNSSNRLGEALAVASNGLVAAVGAPQADDNGLNSGRVVVYQRDDLSSGWVESSWVTPDSGAAGDRFGNSVALNSDGTLLVVGAKQHDGNDANLSGAVFTFERTGSAWAQRERLSDTAAAGWFGSTLALDGSATRLAVGSLAHVTIFVRSGATWERTVSLEGGLEVALNHVGDTLLVGAWGANTAAGNLAGRALLYTNTADTWTLKQELQPEDAEERKNFGRTVALSANGERAFIGTRGGLGVPSSPGHAYIFDLANGEWSETQRVTAPSSAEGTGFGAFGEISNDGHRILIGAPYQGAKGALYEFVDASGSFTLEQHIAPDVDTQSLNSFGSAMAYFENDSKVLVGDVGKGTTGSGLAFFVDLERDCGCSLIDECLVDNGGCDVVATCTNGPAPGDAPTCACPNGYETADAGFTCTAIDECLVNNGGCDALATCSDTASSAPACSCPAGYETFDAGATCNDIDECVIGNGGCDAVATCQGGANPNDAPTCMCPVGFEGDGQACRNAPALVPSSLNQEAEFGQAVVVSQDGLTLVVYASGAAEAGQLEVFQRGSAQSHWALLQTLNTTVTQPGNSTSSLDVSADGSVIALGDEFADVHGDNAGVVYAWRRSGPIFGAAEEVTPENPTPGGRFGRAVQLSSDGDTLLASGLDGAGSVYQLSYTAGTWQQAQQILPPAGHTQFGFDLTASPDGAVLLIGATGYHTPGLYAGSAHVYVQAGGLYEPHSVLTKSDAAAGDRFGSHLSTSADGAVLLVGSDVEATLFERQGAAYIEATQISVPVGGGAGTKRFESSDMSADGAMVVLGAPTSGRVGEYARGAVFAYEKGGASWSRVQEIFAPGIWNSPHGFGRAVQLDEVGFQVVVGSPNAATFADHRGRVYTYALAGCGCTAIVADECLTDNGGCDALASCVDTAAEAPSCTCPAGYETSDAGVTCSDIDECAVSNGGCDAIATCANAANPGDAPMCACPTGYETGDAGATCYDIDECATDNGGCDVNAACTNAAAAGDAPTCACPAGYETTDGGATCTEIDYCSSSPCGANASCANGAEGFVCSCVAGFQGDGIVCNDVDECAAGTDDCHGNARCLNNYGSFQCQCEDGYVGNGAECSDVDECTADAGVCGTNASCFNAPGSYDCQCDVGYFGGTRCTNDPLVRRITAEIPAPSSLFGSSVGVFGDIAVIGARNEGQTGVAHVFTRDASGAWQAVQNLTASDGQSGDAFGTSVALHGNLIVVGAPQVDRQVLLGTVTRTAVDVGAVYVFRKAPDGVFVEERILLPSDDNVQLYYTKRGARFGEDVNVYNNAIVVSAPRESAAGQTRAGSVHVFEDDGAATWADHTLITAPLPTAAGAFGSSLSFTADFLAVGDLLGEVHLFTRDNFTAPMATFADESSGAADFGRALALSSTGELAIGILSEKSVRIYANSGAGWAQRAMVTDVDGSTFGAAVTWLDDGLIVADTSYYDSIATTRGRVSLFRPDDAGGFVVQASIPSATNAGEFGSDLAVSNGRLLIGSPREHETYNSAGAAYFVDATESCIQANCRDENECALGVSGCDQACINEPGGVTCACAEGFVFDVLLGTCVDENECAIGNPCGSDASCTNLLGSYICECEAGYETMTCRAGILQPEGTTTAFSASALSDDATVALVGLPFEVRLGQARAGAAYVLRQVAGEWVVDGELVVSSLSNERFGTRVALSGDGRTAVVAGLTTGRLRVFRREATGEWAQSSDIVGVLQSDGFGASFDLSFDGARLVVGAPNDQEGGYQRGSVYVFDRQESGVHALSAKVIPQQNVRRAGMAVAITADGADFVTGAAGSGALGAAVLFRNGVVGDWLEGALLSSSVVDSALRFGTAVAIADDAARVVVGAPSQSSTGNGEAVVFEATSAGWSETVLSSADDDYLYGRRVMMNRQGTLVLAGADSPYGHAETWAINQGEWVRDPALMLGNGALTALAGESRSAIHGGRVVYLDDNNCGCLNIDECADETDRCAAGGLCYDNPGSFDCECADGYVGDAEGYAALQTVALQSDDVMKSMASDEEHNWVLVGQPKNNDMGGDRGAVAVFQRAMTGEYEEVQRIYAPPDANVKQFGQTVAMSNDGTGALLASLSWVDGDTLRSPQAYFATQSGGVWSLGQEARFTATIGGVPVAASIDEVRSAVFSSNGETAVLLTPYYAYVFTKQPSGEWQSTQRYLADDVTLTSDGQRIAFVRDNRTHVLRRDADAFTESGVFDGKMPIAFSRDGFKLFANGDIFVDAGGGFLPAGSVDWRGPTPNIIGARAEFVGTDDAILVYHGAASAVYRFIIGPLGAYRATTVMSGPSGVNTGFGSSGEPSADGRRLLVLASRAGEVTATGPLGLVYAVELPPVQGTCSDVDECLLATAECDVNASCRNEEGGYDCSCDAGYEGDGLSCSDIDECAVLPMVCDSLAQCSNTTGAFECGCLAGYEGDGERCNDGLPTIIGGPDESRAGSAIDASADGRVLVMGARSPVDSPSPFAGQVVIRRSFETWNYSGTQSATGMGRAVAVSPDGRFVVVGSRDRVDVFTLKDTGSPGRFGIFSPWAYADFGSALDVNNSGEVFVGAPGLDAGAAGAGAVAIYRRASAGSTWTLAHVVNSSTPSANMRFGSSVCASNEGTTVVVDAPGYGAAGASVVLTHDGQGTWSEQVLDGTERADNQARPVSVSVDGARVLVGRSDEDPVRAHLYQRVAGTYALESTFTSADLGIEATTAVSVGLRPDGDSFVIGAPSSGGGKLIVFQHDGAQWSQFGEFIDWELGSNAQLGASVVLTQSPADIFAGTPGFTTGGGFSTLNRVGGAYRLPLQLAPCGCADIDECTLGIDDCTDGAACANRAGSFACFCDIGHEGDGTDCSPCAAGTAKPYVSNSVCTACPPGRYQDELGQSQCKWCAPGSAQDEAGHAACDLCPLGEYQAFWSRPQCDSCAPGTFADSLGTVACNACAPGSIQPTEGQAACNACAPGTAQSEPGQTACSNCEPGTAQAQPGQSDCTACDPGTVQAASGQTQCPVCPDGEYQPNAGETACTPCGGGTEPDAARTACVDTDECLMDNGGCDLLADCTNAAVSGDAPTCVCPSGYDSNDGGVTCDDIDECSMGNGGCDENATCMNTVGSRLCTCNEGYVGDGEGCELAVLVECSAPMIESAQFIRLTERDASRWPFEDICDDRTNAKRGFASKRYEDSGTIRLLLDDDYDLGGIEVFNDFRTRRGQGANELDVTFYDVAGVQIGDVQSVMAKPDNQLHPNGPDRFFFLPVEGVRRVDLDVISNFTNEGNHDRLEIREVRFVESVAPLTADCVDSAFSEVRAYGLSTRNSRRRGLGELCDGVSLENDGYSSKNGEDSGLLVFDLAEPTAIEGVRLFNDFGNRRGQGASDLEISLVGANGEVLFGPQSFDALAQNQRPPNGPDIFAIPPTLDVARILINVRDNFIVAKVRNRLELREFEIVPVVEE